MTPGLIALLALLVLVIAWAALEIRELNQSVGPLANSPIARALSGIGS